jgi:hypothetical protein
MAGPGIIGSIADRRYGTSFLALTGFGVGLVLGTVGLLVLAKRFTPRARGKPLAWDDEDPELSPDDSDGDNPSP